MRRWSFTLQLEFLIKRVEHHELIHTVRKSCVQDRTLYEDPEIFAKYLHGLGHMTDAELDLYFEYFQRLPQASPQPDKVICFDVPKVDVLLERIQQPRPRGGEGHPGRLPARAQRLLRARFPQVLQSKYGIDCLTLDVSGWTSATGRAGRSSWTGSPRFLRAMSGRAEGGRSESSGR